MQEPLTHEWVTLQNNHEAYERCALLIKLMAVLLVALGLMVGLDIVVLAALLLVLWIQEAILKTWQGRFSDRLLAVEQAIKTEAQISTATPFQLHSQWLAQRPRLAGLLGEYARSAVRPTVAFPYAVLLVLVAVL